MGLFGCRQLMSEKNFICGIKQKFSGKTVDIAEDSVYNKHVALHLKGEVRHIVLDKPPAKKTIGKEKHNAYF